MKNTIVLLVTLLSILIIFQRNAHASTQPVLENDLLRVSVADNGAIQFTHKKAAVVWGNPTPNWIEILHKNEREIIPLLNSDIKTELKGDSLFVTFSSLK